MSRASSFSIVLSLLTVLHTANTHADTIRPEWPESDITDELQQAIFDAPPAGRRIILADRDKPYTISRPIVITQDNVHIMGVTNDDGNDKTVDPPLTLIKAAKNWSGFTMFFAFLGVKKCSIQDLRINGNADVQKPRGGQYAILLAGTEKCLVRNLEMWNVGHSIEHPGGSCVTLTAMEKGEAHAVPRLDREIFIRTPFGEKNEGTKYDLRQDDKRSKDNTIARCMFDDLTPNLEMRASFAVRVLTSWWATLEHDEYKIFAIGNKVTRNWFEGYYDSALEIGGPGTRHNLVSRNFVRNGFQTPIETDKGASYNDIEYNVVKTNWTLQHTNGISDDEPKDARSYPFRDQGFSKPDVPVRFARNNRFRWNRAERVVGRVRKKTGMFLLNRSINVTLRGNYLGQIGKDEGNDAQMYAVTLDNYVEGSKFNAGTNSLPLRDRHRNKLELFLRLDEVEVKDLGSANGFKFRN